VAQCVAVFIGYCLIMSTRGDQPATGASGGTRAERRAAEREAKRAAKRGAGGN